MRIINGNMFLIRNEEKLGIIYLHLANIVLYNSYRTLSGKKYFQILLLI